MRGRTLVETSNVPPIEAATLVPVYRGDSAEIRIVLVRRSEVGIHGGQLAFPGGKYAPGDQSMLDTALREAREEIGISCKKRDVLASLPVVETMTSGFLIYPFLAHVVRPAEWCKDEREISEILEVELLEFIQPGVHDEEMREFPLWTEPRRTPFYWVGGYKLWGATYRILHPLIPRLLGREWLI